ncbi:uncharacterized protein LOC134818038 [Bolinopsis microptera]|uniref:uncharacterized protein LOC134818038 n=1 Tax=Bolinopsis microptera TaxID=2820187 RepID=UPI003079DE5B
MNVFVYLLLMIMIASAAEQFSIWKTDSERSYEGLLLVSINGAARKNVCRRYSTYHYYPDTGTSLQICKKLHFHQLVSTGNTGSLYLFRSHYTSGMYYLRGCNPTCSYSASTNCLSVHYFTKISCGCSGNFYATADGCIPCPTNSVNATGTVGRCSCEAGLYWSVGHCIPCPAYKYSAANSVNCTQCPNGATSTPGSSNCFCFPGLHKEGTECRECGGNTFSVRNSTSCTNCPENSTASLDHSACECQDNYLWNPAGNNCTETEKNISQNITRIYNKPTPAPQTPDKKTKLGNPHPVTTALLIVILVAVLACLVAIVIRTSWRKTKEPGRMIMGGLQDRDLPTGPPPKPPACCVDEEDIYVEQD